MNETTLAPFAEHWLFVASGYALAIAIAVFKRPNKHVRRYMKMFNDVSDQNAILREQNGLLTKERDDLKKENEELIQRLDDLEKKEKHNARLISDLVDDKKKLSSKVENMYQAMVEMRGKLGDL